MDPRLRGDDNSGGTNLNYIDNLKLKFNCAYKSELIEKAIIAGYLNIIPLGLLSNTTVKTIK